MLKRALPFLFVLLSFITPAVAQQAVLKNQAISASGTASAVEASLIGIEGVSISVTNAGTYTLDFQGYNGIAWVSYPGIQLSDFSRDVQAAAPDTWFFGNLGFSRIRVYASAYTSGAPRITIVRGFGNVTAPYSAGSVSGANAAASTTGSAVPSSGSYEAVNIGGNLVGVTGLALGATTKAPTMALVDAAGVQITSFGGGTQYATGAATGTPTGTVSLGWDGANVRALNVTAAGVLNLNNIAGTVSLPTGAATAANQTTEVTALQLIDNLPNTIGSTTAGQSGVLSFGAVTTGAPTYTTAQSAPLSLDTTGALRVAGSSGTTQYAEDAAHVDGNSTVFVSAIRRDTVPTSSAGLAGDYAAVNVDANGRVYTNTVLYDAAGAALTLNSDKAEDSAAADADTGPTGLSVRRDTLATSAGANNDYATINQNSVGAAYTQPTAGVSGGASSAKRSSLGVTEDEHEVKATAGILYSVTLTNTSTAVRYIRCADNTAAGTTPGTTTPIIDLAIPGAAAAAGITFPFPVGLQFSTGLTCWFVTGAADTDVTEVAANEIKALYSYK